MGYILDISLFSLLVGTLVFFNSVSHNYHQICVNPNKYCPYSYITTNLENYSLDSRITIDLHDPNATEMEKKLIACAKECEECQDMMSLYKKNTQIPDNPQLP